VFSLHIIMRIMNILLSRKHSPLIFDLINIFAKKVLLFWQNQISVLLLIKSQMNMNPVESQRVPNDTLLVHQII
jgi:hypothetical protein